MMDTEEGVVEQGNTQNALLKSLLNKLRLSGSKLKHEKFEKFNFSIPAGSASLDTPHNQGKQSDQLGRVGRRSAGFSPFELGRSLPASLKPSPSSKPPTKVATAATTSSAAPFATSFAPPLAAPLESSAGGAGPYVGPVHTSSGGASAFGSSGGGSSHVHAHHRVQRSLDAALAAQQSWGSPRSEALRASEAGAVESLRPLSHHQLAGLASLNSSLGGAAGSSGGAVPRKFVRPANVPPLNFSRLGIPDDARSRSRRSDRQAAPSSPLSPALSGIYGAATAPLTPQQYRAHLAESLADLDEELAGWAAAPRWNPTNQGRWYLYPPIGRKEVTPVEQLVETLTPSQAAAVVLLWRQYAAARYSAELMAGRAVRLCRELSHELVECRAEVEERTQRHADHAAQLGKAIVRLQQQLDEARRAAAAATAAANATAAAAAAQAADAAAQAATADAASNRQSQQLQSNSATGTPQHAQSQPLTAPGSGPAASSPAARRQVSGRAPAPVSPQVSQHASGRAAGSSEAATKEKRPTGEDGSAADGQAPDNEELVAQLAHMRALFLEAHEDSCALREALREVDEQNMQLYEQSNGLRRHAAAVLRENDSLRGEVAQLRGLLAAGPAAAAAMYAAGAPGVASAGGVPSTTAPGVSSSVGSLPAGGSGSRRMRAQVVRSSGGGTETGLRASVSLPLVDHLAVVSPLQPSRPPQTTAVATTAGVAVGNATPVSSSGMNSAGSRSSTRRVTSNSIEGPASGAARDLTAPMIALAPPLPPARTSARIPGHAAVAGLHVLPPHRMSQGGSGGGRAPDAAHMQYLDKIVVGSSGGGGMGVMAGERYPGRDLSAALAADGAMVVVRANRRGTGGVGVGGSSGGQGDYLTSLRARYLADCTQIAAAAAAAAAGAGSFGSMGMGMHGSSSSAHPPMGGLGGGMKGSAGGGGGASGPIVPLLPNGEERR